MRQQVYVRDPATGRWTWMYVDRGAVKVRELRGYDLAPRSAVGDVGRYGRKVGR